MFDIFSISPPSEKKECVCGMCHLFARAKYKLSYRIHLAIDAIYSYDDDDEVIREFETIGDYFRSIPERERSISPFYDFYSERLTEETCGNHSDITGIECGGGIIDAILSLHDDHIPENFLNMRAGDTRIVNINGYWDGYGEDSEYVIDDIEVVLD